jgi:hypothetical protein
VRELRLYEGEAERHLQGVRRLWHDHRLLVNRFFPRERRVSARRFWTSHSASSAFTKTAHGICGDKYLESGVL